MAKPKVVIRKYGNRRLYDTSASRYVNLEEIARMVRDGSEIQVVDSGTGEDVTRVILTQIIVEEARDQKAGLPLHVLRELVVASEGATHELLSWYIDSARQLRGRAQETLESGLSGARQAVTNPLEFVRQLVPGLSPAPPVEDGEIEALRARIEELESRLARRKPAAWKRKKV
jgi:polyhydroxyalkanoate synthesis repressor PhaR